MHPKNKAKAEYCNIPLWHQAGYTGKGVVIATLEGNTGHGAQTADILRQVAPDANILHRPQPGLSITSGKLSPESYIKLRAHYQGLVAEGVHIVTASLVGNASPDIVQLQKDILYSNGIIMFAAAGNFGDWDMGDLAKLPFWVAVGNCDLVEGKPVRVRDSSIGEELDVCGFGVLSLSNGKWVSGTSYSCPWVVGMVALWYQWYREQYNRYPTWQECYDFVTSNTVDLETPGHDIYTGHGLFVLPRDIPKEAEDMKLLDHKAVKYLVVHHSASGDVSAATLRQWHLSRGFSDIGYHWVVRQDGTIEKGRDERYQGAHSVPVNSQSIGICCTGDFTKQTMPAAQRKALVNLLIELRQRYPQAQITQHKNHDATACPGNIPFVEIWQEVLEMFTDVPKDHWAVESIERLSKLGIVTGYNDGTFRPDEPVTRAQVTVIVDRVLKQLGK